MSAAVLDITRIAKTDDCANCHSDVASHWANSAHAYASFDNPWYRASIDQFRKERGADESRFCAGCHDPLLLMSGDIDRDVTPQNELAYAGITCLVCHSVESTRPDGNASFSLTNQAVLLPDPANPEEIETHRAQLTMKPLRTAALCGSCHRSFSGPSIGNENHLPGIDDLGDWSSSAFAGAVQNHLTSVDENSCQGCHMPFVPASDAEMSGAFDGMVSSHRWTASHTAMAVQLPDPGHAEQAAGQLGGAVVVDIGPVRAGSRRYLLPEESRLRGTERLVLDVLLENRGTGHRFPGGVRDMQDVWLEVEVRAARALASERGRRGRCFHPAGHASRCRSHARDSTSSSSILRPGVRPHAASTRCPGGSLLDEPSTAARAPVASRSALAAPQTQPGVPSRGL